MENPFGNKIIYCNKCGRCDIFEGGDKTDEELDRLLKASFVPCYCGGEMEFLDTEDEAIFIKEFELEEDKDFLVNNGYPYIDDAGFVSSNEYRMAVEQKIIQKYISKRPTFDEYAMRYRLEQDIQFFKELELEIEMSKKNGKVKKAGCPHCGSENIRSIDTLERAVSVGAFGLASGKMGKSFKCRNCGYTW